MQGLLAFDLGTSGVKCSLFNEKGELLGARYGQYNTYYPVEDWREQRPEDWIRQIKEATVALRQELPQVQICGIGVSGHSLGALPVDKDGTLLARQIPIPHSRAELRASITTADVAIACPHSILLPTSPNAMV